MHLSIQNFANLQTIWTEGFKPTRLCDPCGYQARIHNGYYTMGVTMQKDSHLSGIYLDNEVECQISGFSYTTNNN